MSRKKTPFAVLGMDETFVRTTPPALVIKAAEHAHAAIMKFYHPDTKGEKTKAVDLTPFNEALDAIRKEPLALIKEIKQGTRRSKAEAATLTAEGEVQKVNEDLESQRALTQSLWDQLIHERSGIRMPNGEIGTAARPAHNTQNLGGMAILVDPIKGAEDEFIEYQYQKGCWIGRKLVKVRWGKQTPVPHGISADLVSGAEIGNGYFYDQMSVHKHLPGFDIVGSYSHNDLEDPDSAENPAPKVGMADVLLKKVGKAPSLLNPDVMNVLYPVIQVGRQLVCSVTTGQQEKSINLEELGRIVMIRSFDRNQRMR